MAGDKGHSQNVGKLWSEDQVVGKRWSERPKRASRLGTVVRTAKSWRTVRGTWEHVHGHTWVTVGIG